MNEIKLRQLVAEAVGLDREISLQQDRLKDLKARLVVEARSRLEEDAAAGASFESLFVPSLAYVPIEGFRVEAANLLGASAPKLIKLCETESRPRVCFETKPSPAL
jgi:hypothetical protein